MATLTPEIKDYCPCCNQPIFNAPRDVLKVGPLTLDPKLSRLFVEGEHVHVTKQEFDFLYMLASRAGQAVSKDTLFALLYSLESDVDPQIINVLVCKLRRKLRTVSETASDHIQTVWGMGYALIEKAI